MAIHGHALYCSILTLTSTCLIQLWLHIATYQVDLHCWSCDVIATSAYGVDVSCGSIAPMMCKQSTHNH